MVKRHAAEGGGCTAVVLRATPRVFSLGGLFLFVRVFSLQPFVSLCGSNRKLERIIEISITFFYFRNSVSVTCRLFTIVSM